VYMNSAQMDEISDKKTYPKWRYR